MSHDDGGELPRLEARGTYLYLNGRRIFLVGVNYWPRRHPIWKMWKEFDERELEAEAAQMARIGINAVRIFIFGEDFAPGPYRINEESVEKLRKLIRIFYRHGILVFPTLLVGHMSGENWEIPWREGRDLYRDHEAISRMLWFIRELVRRVRGEPGIGAWILSNELPLYIGGADFETVEHFTRYVYHEVKRLDPDRLYTTGDGHMFDRGYAPERLREGLDYFGPHVYTFDNDVIRQTYWYSFMIRYCVSLGKPAVLEEFGCSAAQVSEENQAALYSIALHSILIAGASGAFAWCFSDFTTEDIRPYIHHPHELRLGITRADGSERPAAEVIRRFRRALDKIELDEYSPPKPEAAILIPSYVYTEYPFLRVDVFESLRILEQAYTMARMASLDVTFIREEDPPERFLEHKLVIVPCPVMLLTTTWRKLIDYVRRGGSLLMSYRFAMMCHVLEELFGIEHNMVHGVPSIPEVDALRMKIEAPIGHLEPGTTMAIPLSGDEASAICEVVHARGSVMAVDEATRLPLLTGYAALGGRSFLVTFPLEWNATRVRNFNMKSRAFELYRAIAREAGIISIVESSNPYVEAGCLASPEELLLIVVNHAYTPQSTRIAIRAPISKAVDIYRGRELPIINSEGGSMLELALGKGEGMILRLQKA